MADSGNMVFSNDSSLGYLVLNPLRKPTKEYINSLTDEVIQLSVETVDGKEYVCTRDGQVLSDNPNKYRDIPYISNPEDKKYMLTNYTKEYDGQTLYRIRALKDFGNVKAGELGGYVAGEHNLSQYGNSWIQTDSKVFNLAYVGDNAIVRKSIMYGNAKAIENCRVIHTTMYGDSIIKGFAISNNSYIYHKSVICGESRVSGHLAFEGIIKDKVFIKDPGARITGNGIEISDEVQISENVKIDGHAKIRGRSRIMGNSEITDYAEISGDAIITDYAQITSHAQIRGHALIKGNAKLTEFVCICENSRIEGDVVLSGDTIVKGNTHISTQEQANKVIKPCICKTSSNEITL